jgi:hypothetical protein
MPRSRDYSEVIDLIYEAALDPRGWPRVADRLADLCGATIAQIISHDSETFAVTNIAPRADPETVRNYVQHWVYHNPLIEPTQRIPLGSVFTFDRIMPRRELARTAIYNEFFAPAGMEERLGVRLLAEGSSTALANLYRPARKGAFERVDEELLASLVPHLQRALQLNVRLADLEISRTASAQLLDRLSQASLLVDAACRVLFANRAAEDILVDQHGVHRSGDGTLRTNRQIETFYLHKFVASAAGRIIDGKAGGGGRIRISRGEERAPLIVLVIPLRAETEWLSPRRPTAILFITDPERANTPTAASL